MKVLQGLSMLLIAGFLASSEAAETNWNRSATYADLIAARKTGAKQPSLSKFELVRRIVGRDKSGKVLVETRDQVGKVTTNAMQLHVIYNARTVAEEVEARKTYNASAERFVRALAKADGSEKDALSVEPSAVLRQAERINKQSEKIEKK